MRDGCAAYQLVNEKGEVLKYPDFEFELTWANVIAILEREVPLVKRMLQLLLLLPMSPLMIHPVGHPVRIAQD